MLQAVDSEQSSNLKCMRALEFDLHALIDLQNDACEGYRFHSAIWGTNTPANRYQAKERLQQKWHSIPNLQPVKCINRDTKELMAWCIWEIVGQRSSRAEAVQEDVIMTSCEWLGDSARELARAYLIPAVEKRWDIMQGREYFLLTNLCTAPHCRNRGAAQALVDWGLDQAKQKRMPAYCEASDVALGTYTRLGFKKMGNVETRLDGKLVDECAVMVARYGH